MYLFDSDVLIEFLRGRLPNALEMLRNTDARLVKVPAVAKAELLLGAAKSQNPERNRLAVEKLLLEYEVLPFDDRCTAAYAQIRVDLEQQGRTVGANDYLVAATALAWDATLVTNSMREFKRIPGLRLLVLSEVDLNELIRSQRTNG